MVHGSLFQARGIPDIIGVCDGRFYGFEAKLPGKPLRKIQKYVINQIRKNGGIAERVDSSAAALEIVYKELARCARSSS